MSTSGNRDTMGFEQVATNAGPLQVEGRETLPLGVTAANNLTCDEYGWLRGEATDLVFNRIPLTVFEEAVEVLALDRTRVVSLEIVRDDAGHRYVWVVHALHDIHPPFNRCPPRFDGVRIAKYCGGGAVGLSFLTFDDDPGCSDQEILELSQGLKVLTKNCDPSQRELTFFSGDPCVSVAVHGDYNVDDLDLTVLGFDGTYFFGAQTNEDGSVLFLMQTESHLAGAFKEHASATCWTPFARADFKCTIEGFTRPYEHAGLITCSVSVRDLNRGMRFFCTLAIEPQAQIVEQPWHETTRGALLALKKDDGHLVAWVRAGEELKVMSDTEFLTQ